MITPRRDSKVLVRYAYSVFCVNVIIFLFLCLRYFHKGVPNRQLTSEDDELAILYNDESIAENRSLYVAFSEFLKPDYAELRDAMFPTKDVYRRFRKQVVNLVLNTDIASPERTQLNKSKWKEAFGNYTGASSLNSMDSMDNLSRASSSSSLEEQDDDDDDDDDDESGGMLKHVRRSIATGNPTEERRRAARVTEKHHRSNSAPPTKSFRQRLGIRRSMDLSGEALESYSSHRDDGLPADNDDDVDDLKAEILMERIMTAADVAHNLQGWEQMVIWSSRLYNELRRAHVNGRGFDSSANWFSNQIGFLDSYLLPLANQLDTTGAFTISNGSMAQLDQATLTFADIVKSSRDKWLLDGGKWQNTRFLLWYVLPTVVTNLMYPISPLCFLIFSFSVDVSDEAIRKGNEAFPQK